LVWDASKSPGDLITSSDWNDMVTDQKGHSSRHEVGGTDEVGAAGSDTQIQFNSSGSFSGSSELVWDSTNSELTVLEPGGTAGTDELRLYDTSNAAFVSTPDTELVMQETGDDLGTVSLKLQNRTGSNGAIFQNDGVDLVDFGFVPQSGGSAQWNLRFENRSGNAKGDNNRNFAFGPSGSFGNNIAFFVGDVEAGFNNIDHFGIGTYTPQEKLDVKGNALLDGGNVLLPQDSGSTTLADMSVSSSPSQGTEQSIGIDIDGTRIFKAYAEADGAGGVQQTALDMSTNKIQNVGLIDGVDITSHASRHEDGGNDELDAADLSGASGTSGQVLQTDGSAASWVDFSGGHSVSDNGSQVLAEPDDVNFGNQLDVTDDSDGTVTVDANVSTESTNTVSSNYSTSGETTIFADVSGGSLTVTLSSSDVSDGKIVRVMDKTGNADSNNITVNTESSETINGETDAVINDDFESLTFQSDGTDWFIVSRMGGGSVV
jgi:hypothetical protein